MNSLQTFGGLRTIHSSEKLSKPRAKVVKPILKKWSYSEKNSLDLDRGWEDQDEKFRFPNSSNNSWDVGSKDVSFALFGGANDGLGGAAGSGGTSGGGRLYNHARSVSGASHVSVATTSSAGGVGMGSGIGGGVGPRTGIAFVHPFQQMPRTATPPLNLSYANSLVDGITEDENDEDEDSDAIVMAGSRSFGRSRPDQSSIPSVATTTTVVAVAAAATTLSSYSTCREANSAASYPSAPPHSSANSYSRSQSSLHNIPAGASGPRRPSLASSQRTSSTDLNNPHPHPPPPLRINTSSTRSTSTTPAQSSRLAHVSSGSDLNLPDSLDSISPTNTHAPTSSSSTYHSFHTHASPPSSVAEKMSPFSRSSLEAAIPRLRAKSDVDTSLRQEQLREARRKFEAREQAKEEKYAREEIKRRERAENKRAQQLEKQVASLRKEQDAHRFRLEQAALAEAMPRGSKHVRKMSATSSGRPSLSRRTTGTAAATVTTTMTPATAATTSAAATRDPEKFAAGNYDAMEMRNPPAFGHRAGTARGVSFEGIPKRSSMAKRRTHGAWQSFVLWLRTKLLRSNRDQSSI